MKKMTVTIWVQILDSDTEDSIESKVRNAKQWELDRLDRLGLKEEEINFVPVYYNVI